MAEMDLQAGMVRLERKERGVLRVHLGSKVRQDNLGSKVDGDLQHETVVECSTLAGEEQRALVDLERNWSMLEE